MYNYPLVHQICDAASQRTLRHGPLSGMRQFDEYLELGRGSQVAT
jgi:hypothetical protein